MAAFLLVVCAFATIGAAAGLEEIPSFLRVCAADDPDLNSCIIDSTHSLAPIFGTGYAPMDLPSLNPFTIPDFVVSPKSSGLYMTMKDLHIYNANNFTVKQLKIIEHGRRYQFDLYFPFFHTNGTYVLKGQLLMLRLEGTGPSNSQYYGVSSRVNVKIDHEPNAKGELSPRLTELKMRIKLKKGVIRLDNLFNGDKVLGDTINQAVNDNFDVFAGELMPVMQERLSVLLMKYANKLLGHFTSAQLFPKVPL